MSDSRATSTRSKTAANPSHHFERLAFPTHKKKTSMSEPNKAAAKTPSPGVSSPEHTVDTDVQDLGTGSMSGPTAGTPSTPSDVRTLWQTMQAMQADFALMRAAHKGEVTTLQAQVATLCAERQRDQEYWKATLQDATDSCNRASAQTDVCTKALYGLKEDVCNRVDSVTQDLVHVKPASSKASDAAGTPSPASVKREDVSSPRVRQAVESVCDARNASTKVHVDASGHKVITQQPPGGSSQLGGGMTDAAQSLPRQQGMTDAAQSLPRQSNMQQHASWKPPTKSSMPYTDHRSQQSSTVTTCTDTESKASCSEDDSGLKTCTEVVSNIKTLAGITYNNSLPPLGDTSVVIVHKALTQTSTDNDVTRGNDVKSGTDVTENHTATKVDDDTTTRSETVQSEGTPEHKPVQVRQPSNTQPAAIPSHESSETSATSTASSSVLQSFLPKAIQQNYSDVSKLLEHSKYENATLKASVHSEQKEPEPIDGTAPAEVADEKTVSMPSEPLSAHSVPSGEIAAGSSICDTNKSTDAKQDESYHQQDDTDSMTNVLTNQPDGAETARDTVTDNDTEVSVSKLIMVSSAPKVNDMTTELANPEVSTHPLYGVSSTYHSDEVGEGMVMSDTKEKMAMSSAKNNKLVKNITLPTIVKVVRSEHMDVICKQTTKHHPAKLQEHSSPAKHQRHGLPTKKLSTKHQRPSLPAKQQRDRAWNTASPDHRKVRKKASYNKVVKNKPCKKDSSKKLESNWSNWRLMEHPRKLSRIKQYRKALRMEPPRCHAQAKQESAKRKISILVQKEHNAKLSVLANDLNEETSAQGFSTAKEADRTSTEQVVEQLKEQPGPILPRHDSRTQTNERPETDEDVEALAQQQAAMEAKLHQYEDPVLQVMKERDKSSKSAKSGTQQSCVPTRQDRFATLTDEESRRMSKVISRGIIGMQICTHANTNLPDSPILLFKSINHVGSMLTCFPQHKITGGWGKASDKYLNRAPDKEKERLGQWSNMIKAQSYARTNILIEEQALLSLYQIETVKLYMLVQPCATSMTIGSSSYTPVSQEQGYPLSCLESLVVYQNMQSLSIETKGHTDTMAYRVQETLGTQETGIQSKVMVVQSNTRPTSPPHTSPSELWEQEALEPAKPPKLMPHLHEERHSKNQPRTLHQSITPVHISSLQAKQKLDFADEDGRCSPGQSGDGQYIYPTRPPNKAPTPKFSDDKTDTIHTELFDTQVTENTAFLRHLKTRRLTGRMGSFVP